jgi:hypothetical protein
MIHGIGGVVVSDEARITPDLDLTAESRKSPQICYID